VEVKAKDGAKEVTVRDQLGNVTWTGPWDTAQDKAAAPAGIRQRVDTLNIDSSFKGAGLRLQMGKPAPPEADEP
jgi:serine protease Do